MLDDDFGGAKRFLGLTEAGTQNSDFVALGEERVLHRCRPRMHDRVERLVVRKDNVACVFGQISILGNDDRDWLSDVSNPLVGDDRLQKRHDGFVERHARLILGIDPRSDAMSSPFQAAMTPFISRAADPSTSVRVACATWALTMNALS